MVILLSVAATSLAYEGEPTDDELTGWFNSLTKAEKIEELRRSDRIDHASPSLTAPRLVVTQTKDGTIDAWFDGPLGFDIAGYLSYEVTLPAVTVKGNPEKNTWLSFGLGAAAGAATIVVLSLVLNILSP